MFKLIFLTLLAFVTILVVFGEGDGRRLEPAAEEVAASPEPTEQVVPSEATDAGVAVVDEPQVEQTPEQQPEFPGPELRPSPEYQGETPQENLAEAPTDTLYVTGNSVNFRAGPSTSNEVVGRLSRGQMVTAVGERSGDWVQIRDGDGRAGYMSAQFLSASRP
ncbi:SH3 domain-containing protein [Paracoccus albus]|uniref:SH3 domain-containing protein n=1 Tax=Paracoccus albus TaxID=3017784 RepID=UPI0022F10122|nr:SH3 domain-containing protein [Paracoccus albus]WBU60756.1 SH3 domain-containing protein [Paracoccus albus]